MFDLGTAAREMSRLVAGVGDDPPQGASRLQRTIARTGRDPGWTADA